MCTRYLQSIHGYHFDFVENIDLEWYKKVLQKQEDEQVYCYETKQIYKTTTAAAKELGVPLRTLQRRCVNNDRSVTNQGYSYSYIKNLTDEEKEEILNGSNT